MLTYELKKSPGVPLYEALYRCIRADILSGVLKPGQKLLFGDMAIYTMVKNNTFNGMPLPDIVYVDAGGSWKTIRTFGYDDFKQRL